VDYLVSTDAILVLRCQEDDSQAFDEIVRQYKDGIYNYILRMISNRDDAEDLAVEVFVRAFAAIKSFRRDSNLRTWLYRIATNLCIDKYRRYGIERKKLVPLEREYGDGEIRPMDLPDTSFDPEKLLGQKELSDQIHRAIAKLPEKLRAPILMYDMEDMSYGQIAEVLGCPIGTVKSRIFKARTQLRRMLLPYVQNT
jgi:RNA polymerase sigma-70 factor (ECF subfamily)